MRVQRCEERVFRSSFVSCDIETFELDFAIHTSFHTGQRPNSAASVELAKLLQGNERSETSLNIPCVMGLIEYA